MTKDELLDHIDKKSPVLIRFGKQLSAISSDLQTFDFYLIGALNRTINLNKAYTTLTREKNFIAAAALIRINLDTLLRLYAGRISEYDLNTFALKIINGEHVRKIKSSNGKDKLTDSYLVEKISEVDGMQWVKSIYESGNAFVHFSDDIIAASRTILNEEKRTIGLSIGHHDSFVTEETKLNATVWMDRIIDAIVIQTQIWMHEKCKAVGYDYEKLNDIE